MRRDLEIEFANLAIKRLEVHPEVQRELRQSHVRKIASNWHPVAMNPPTVVRMSSGKRAWYIIDGQHTVAAAKLVGMQTIPCKVVKAKTRAEMNEIFQLVNSGVMHVSPLDSFKLNAVNDYTTDDYRIRTILKECDLTVGNGDTVRHIRPIQPLRNSYKRLGQDQFCIVAALLGVIADGGSRLDSAAIKAVTEIVRLHSSPNEIEDISEVLREDYPNLRDEAISECIGSTLGSNWRLLAEKILDASFGSGVAA